MNVQNAEFLRLHVASGWHQARTARELALEPSTVSRYLSNQAVPSLTVLRLFAGLLGERLALPGETESASTLRDGPRWLEDWESDLVMVLRRIDPAARPRVIAALREIVDAVAGPGRYARERRLPADLVPSTEMLIAAAADAVTDEDPASAPPASTAEPSGGHAPRSGPGPSPRRPSGPRSNRTERTRKSLPGERPTTASETS